MMMRHQGEQMTQVLELGASLRQAQADLDGDALRELTRQRRAADHRGHPAGPRAGPGPRPAAHRGRSPTRSRARCTPRWSTSRPRRPCAAGCWSTALAATGVGSPTSSTRWRCPRRSGSPHGPAAVPAPQAARAVRRTRPGAGARREGPAARGRRGPPPRRSSTGRGRRRTRRSAGSARRAKRVSQGARPAPCRRPRSWRRPAAGSPSSSTSWRRSTRRRSTRTSARTAPRRGTPRRSWRSSAPRSRARAAPARSGRLLVGPALGALDGVAPPGVRGVGPGPVAARLEAPVELPGLAQVVGRLPDPGAEAGQERGAEGGGLDDLRPLDGYAEQVGLELAEQVVRAGAAVDGQRASGRSATAACRRRRAPRR